MSQSSTFLSFIELLCLSYFAFLSLADKVPQTSASGDDAGASLVVGANTFVAPSGSAPAQVDRIKLAQEHVGLVQKLLVVSNQWLEYLTFID